MTVRIGMVWMALAVYGWAQPYTFLRVAGDLEGRPDEGAFRVGINARPALEGDYLVFRDAGLNSRAQSIEAIWSYNVATGVFVKLADMDTPAPGGAGTMTGLLFDSSPVLRGGIVAFLARDQLQSPYNQGIFSVPVTGGPISRVANYNSADPSGGAFRLFDTAARPYGGFTIDGRVGFGANNASNVTGVYSALPDGSGAVWVADSLHPVRPKSLFPVYQFFNPWVDGGQVAFYGQTVIDNSTGFNAIYTSPVTGPTGTLEDGSPNYAEVVTSDDPLPGDSNPNFHTRLDIPSIQMQGGTIAFIADDANADPAYRGIFTVPAGGGPITKIVASDASLPGLGPLTASGSFNGFAMNGGRILFRAQDLTPGAPGNHGLYLWENGTTTRIIGTGDMLDGRKVDVVFDVGTHALDGDRFAFLVGLAGYGLALYVAQPPDPSVQISGVANAANYANASISPGEIVTIFGQKIGPENLTTFALDETGRVPRALAGARFLINGSPAPPLYVRSDQGSAVVPFRLDEAGADIIAVYNGAASAPIHIPLTGVLPGLFSANQTGAGPGAILNQDYSVNSAANPADKGAVVLLYGTGHGQTVPVSYEGEVAPSTNIPRVARNVQATIGGVAAEIAYAGPAPGLVAGVLQVNVKIPDGVAAGTQEVIVRIDGVASQAGLTVAVR